MADATIDRVRRALERGPRRSSGDNSDLRRLADEIARRMQNGDEVRAWDDLGSHFRWMPEEGEIEAARQLADEDLETLLAMFSSANPVAVQMFVPFLAWSDDLGDRWLRARCSRTVAALGVLRWLESVPSLRAPTPANDEAFERAVGCLGKALSARPRAEEVALWWQALGISHRICSTDVRGVPRRMRVLFEYAAAALARHDGSDVIPSPDEWRVWGGGNSELAAVLPLVAHRAREDHRVTILRAFFADVDERIEREAYERPDIATPGGLLYTNACGHAIALDVANANPAPWWKTTLVSSVARISGWKPDTVLGAIERAAWVACAAAMAAVKLATEPGEGWRLIVPELFDCIDPYLDDWLWEIDYPASARVALQELLVRAACLDAVTAPNRVMRIVAVAQSAAALVVIKKEAAGVLSASDMAVIEKRIALREAYEAALAAGITM